MGLTQAASAETLVLSYTDKGKVREENQDAVYCHSSERIWCVADGMGGHEGGRLASQEAIQFMERFRATPNLGSNARQIRRLVSGMNMRMLELAKEIRTSMIGTTIVVLYRHGNQLFACWVGDSRLYRYNKNNSLDLISRDHCYYEIPNRYDGIDTSTITQSDQALTRAIGGDRTIKPEYSFFRLSAGDRFLLCTDGLTKVIDDGTIAEILAISDLQQSYEELKNHYIASPAQDNIGMVLLSF